MSSITVFNIHLEKCPYLKTCSLHAPLPRKIAATRNLPVPPQCPKSLNATENLIPNPYIPEPRPNPQPLKRKDRNRCISLQIPIEPSIIVPKLPKLLCCLASGRSRRWRSLHHHGSCSILRLCLGLHGLELRGVRGLELIDKQSRDLWLGFGGFVEWDAGAQSL